jgi:hypothetical protein
LTNLRRLRALPDRRVLGWTAAPAIAQAAYRSPLDRRGEPHSASAARVRGSRRRPDARSDLWHRIRVGFLMEPLDSPLVQEHEAWYASRPDYIKRFVDRGSLYLHHIVEEVEKRKMPMEIALLPVIESAFTPKAMSRAKASGIWQFIPSTARTTASPRTGGATTGTT